MCNIRKNYKSFRNSDRKYWTIISFLFLFTFLSDLLIVGFSLQPKLLLCFFVFSKYLLANCSAISLKFLKEYSVRTTFSLEVNPSKRIKPIEIGFDHMKRAPRKVDLHIKICGRNGNRVSHYTTLLWLLYQNPCPSISTSKNWLEASLSPIMSSFCK